MNSSYYRALAFVVQKLPDARPVSQENNSSFEVSNSGPEKITLSGNPEYFWVPEFIFNKAFQGSSYYSNAPFKTEKYIMIVDKGFLNILNGSSRSRERLSLAVNGTTSLSLFEQNMTGGNDMSKYPFTSLKLTPESRYIDIRANY
jgi:hypothetical protein